MAARDFRTRLTRRAGKVGVYLAEDLLEGLVAYYELLTRWNSKINLTSLDDPDQAIDRLLLEPVLAARFLRTLNPKLMDVGSGGGSPAIPMRLAVPTMQLVMVEAKARKSAFLREAVRHLHLDNVQVETSRYEELLAKPHLHEFFDVLSVRAVRIEAKLLVTLQAFVKPGGQLYLFRGPSGPEIPVNMVPPLEWLGTHPLVEVLQSRLTILTKRDHVPRGTWT